MKISVLCENTVNSSGLLSEHGLSLLIEADGKTILFDMGATDLFLKNARLMGAEPEKVSVAVISHGHYDHGGGLSHFLQHNSTAPVYISPLAFEPHYNARDKYIGLDRELMKSSQLVFAQGRTVIGEGMTLYSAGELACPYPVMPFGLTAEKDGARQAETFDHEQYLLLREGDRRILFSGCSHKGILNIVSYFKPDVLVGGFHFSKLAPGEELSDYAAALNKTNTKFYTCHCTGTEQYEFMKGRMKRLQYISTGDIFSV